MNEETHALYPMRINKYLAHKGYATRKGADEIVAKKRVSINGRIAVLGDKVTETDVVEVRVTGAAKQYKYFAYHKPRTVITHSPQNEEQDIAERVALKQELRGTFPIGRLDKDSSGLIILTNDARITERLLGPDREHEKEYIVKTKAKLRDSFKKHMEAGVDIEGYMTKPAKVKLLGETVFAVTLTEGKKHQIRRMVVALHNEVKELKRTRILNIHLGKLAPDEYRRITGEELVGFLNTLGL